MADAKPGLFSGLTLRRPSTQGGTIAHPLLGASASTSSLAESDEGGRSPDSTLPYKPRQRVSTSPSSQAPATTLPPAFGSESGSGSSTAPVHPAPTTTSRTVPDSPGSNAAPPAPPAITTTSTTFAPEESHAGAGAAGRLQIQSLKAAAQRIGLTNGSMGMGMVDAIFEKGARARADGDWAELLKVLTSGKTIILLPSSPASSLPMTPQTLRDHIAFLSPSLPCPGHAAASILVTLSGLIGTLQGTSVVFESSVPPDSTLLGALKDEAHRASVLGRLRPTHLSPSSTSSSPSPSSYPSYVLSEESTSLPFPPLGRGPPPPEKRADPTRRMNPFMSLFGNSASTTPRTAGALSPDRPGSPSAPASTSGRSSPRPSLMSLDDEHAEGYSVTAYVLDKPVRYAEVHKTLVKAVRSAVRFELDGLPDRVVDKVLRFVTGAVCPVYGSGDQALLKSHHHGLGASDSDVPLDFADPNAAGERCQDFMEGVYDDLARHYRAEPSKKWEKDREAEALESYIEDEAGDGTERVEAVVCRLLHNRIFSPLNSDDARHDEALASRIAALNLLDLTLDHLGLITHPKDEESKGALSRGLASLVDNIGAELQKLSTVSCLTPKDKADVLVHAHKIAVDGLSKLPPVELRPEGEPYVPEVETAEDEGLDTITEMAETPALTVSDPFGEGTELTEAIAKPEVVEKEESPPSSDSSEVEKEDSSPKPEVEAEVEAATEKQGDVPPRQATSGADLILPLIIYAVVKANPAQLASQLMYLRRYRSAISLAGEASYAIVNLTAVVEFLEHVQLSELGLGSGQVISVADLSPIGLADLAGDTDSIVSASSRLSRRVFTVSDIAGSAADGASKVLTVVDSGISALRGFMTTAPTEEPAAQTPYGRPRQSSTFSLASVTASVANIAAAATTAAARTRSRASSHGEVVAHGQELVEVAPGAVYSDAETEEQAEDEDEKHHAATVHSPTDDTTPIGRPSRARSIVSVSSMMRDSSHEEVDREREREGVGARLSSIGARLAESTPGTPMSEKPALPSSTSMSGLASGAKEGGLGVREGGGVGGARDNIGRDSVSGASGASGARDGFFASLGRGARRPAPRSPSVTHLALPAGAGGDEGPIERFLTCEVGDIRLHEVAVLLRDYRRLAGVVAKLQAQQQ